MLKSPIANDDWVAIEKVHGTNFAIYLIDEKEVKFGKRSGIMSPQENFFGYHLLLDEFTFQVHAAVELVKQKFGISRIGLLIINGEFHGGKYDHPNVPKSEKIYEIPSPSLSIPTKRYPVASVMIQEEKFPQYSPELHYFAFDLRYSVSGATSDLVTLSYDEACSVFEKVPNLLYGKALARGPLKKVLEFDVENFETPLPALLGLGNYPLEGNYAEGIVVRHVKHDVPGFNSFGTATMLKIRSSAFMELKHRGHQGKLEGELIYQLQKHASQKRNRTEILEAYLPEVEAAAIKMFNNFVAKGRMSNLISKIGIEPLQKGELSAEELTRLFAKDALKDFLKHSDDALLNTSVAFRKKICEHAYHECREYVEKNWKEILRADDEGRVAVLSDQEIPQEEAAAATE